MTHYLVGLVQFGAAVSRSSYCTRPADDAVSRSADDPIESGFLATLLAMAGDDLRQPLQVITSAHDVLATMLRNKEQREELARARVATGQLAGIEPTHRRATAAGAAA